MVPLPTWPLAIPVFVRQGGASASLEQRNDIIKIVLDIKSEIQSPSPLPPDLSLPPTPWVFSPTPPPCTVDAGR